MHSSIEEKLDQLKACVHCGMCLPACPTYLTTGNEGHSPRGRLYLIRDFVESSLRDEGEAIPSHVIASEAKQSPNDSETINYLDACLECRACETVCPSGVEYASILDYARNQAKLTMHNKGFIAFIRQISFKYLLPNRYLLNANRIILRIINCLKINKLLSFISTFKLSPRLEQPYQQIQTNHTYSANYPQATTISLPLGCVMDTLYNHVHWDTIKVLNAFGYNVYIPETHCCGALAGHSGEHGIGAKQTQATLEKLSQHPYPVVFNSAGCGAHLKQSTQECHSERSEESSTPRILDFIELIQNAPVKIQDFAKQLKNDKSISATYHPACHLNHAQGIRTEYQELLKLIPNLTLIPLAEADVCCGSAGFYNLIHPQMADAIGARKAGNIKNSKAEILVTANPGCISQIQAHMPDQKILHPISLIAQCLND